MSSMQAARSRPKSMKVHSMPSRWYSSCTVLLYLPALCNGLTYLLEDKHVVIEELLQLLIDEVDPHLFERVELHAECI